MLRSPRNAASSLAAVLALAASLFLPAPSLASSDAGEPLTDFHREWVWSTFGSLVGEGGLEVVDLDGDGRTDLLATGDTYDYYGDRRTRWFQLRYAAGFRQTWSSLAFEETLRFVRSAEIAGARQIAAITDDRVYVYDGRTKALLRSFPLTAVEAAAAQLEDLDGDGAFELLVCDPGALFVHDFASGAQLAVKWGFGCTDVATGNTDGDFAREIALAGNSLGGFVLDGVTLTVDWATVSGFGDRVRLTDVDHDGLDEVVCGSNFTPLRAIDPTTSLVLWQTTAEELSALEVGDVDGNGDEEVLYAEYYPGGTLIALEETTGTEVWTLSELLLDEIYSLAVGDPDEDGDDELIIGASSSYYGSKLLAIDLGSLVMEAQSAELAGPMAGLEVVDLESDARLDLVTACASFMDNSSSHGALLSFDVPSRQIEYVGTPVPAGLGEGTITRVTTAQLDGDAALEICYVYGDYYDGVVGCEDGLTHLSQWIVTMPDNLEVRSLMAVDLDADAGEEVVVGTNSPSIYAFEGDTGWLKWATQPLQVNGSFTTLRHGDVVDGPEEEVVASNASDYYADPIAAFDLATGSLAAGPYEQYPGVTTFELTQLDGGGPLEVVVGTTDYDLVEFDLQSGTYGANIASSSGIPLSLRVGDVSRDGDPDFVFVVDGRIQVWGGAEDSLLWTSAFLGDEAGYDDMLWIGNFDADGVPEIAISTGFGFAIFEAPLFELFVDGFESGDTSAWSATQP